MPRNYYTLLVQDSSGWHIAFGDYSRRDVVKEKSCYDEPTRIVKSFDDQASIDEAVKPYMSRHA